MRSYEKAASHVLFFFVFAAALLNIELALGGRLQAWNLPVLYVLYVGGVLGWRALKARPIKPLWVGLLVVLPLLCLLLAQGLSRTYDTSWDGQDYQQSAVIALADGWNPWHDNKLPIQLPVSEEYVVGYPKTTWLLQASAYKLTGTLQAAPVLNFVIAGVAAAWVFGLLRRLRLHWRWAAVFAVLAVAEIHFIQQAPTFMADGYSYQLGLIAIASFLVLLLERNKTWPLATVLAVWLLLAGAKFSNLFVCAVIGVAVFMYGYRARLYHDQTLQKILGVMVVAGLLTLWVPYGKNTVTYRSPVYPQNQAAESGKLRYDNVPNNLKHDNRLALLFYGVFSSTEPGNAGDPESPENKAELKWPFTFRRYEIQEVNNFQGRVGSGGFLFSGIVVVTTAALAVLAFARPQSARPGLLRAAALLIAVIVIAALVIPVPNKLRYSPLITSVPLIAAIVCVSISGKRARLGQYAALGIIALVAVNILVSSFSLVRTRIRDSRNISTQLTSLQQSHATYHVHAANFYSNYVRMQEHHIPIVIDKQLPCTPTQALEFSYGTTLFCR